MDYVPYYCNHPECPGSCIILNAYADDVVGCSGYYQNEIKRIEAKISSLQGKINMYRQLKNKIQGKKGLWGKRI